MSSLAPSADTYRLIAESVDDIFSLHALDGSFLFVSPAGERLTGFTNAEVAARGEGIVHPDDAARVVEESRVAALAGRVAQTRWRCLRRDGSYVWVETRTTVHFAANGVPDCLLCVSREISDRIAAEAALQASETRYRALADSFPNGAVGLVDSDLRLVVIGGNGLAVAGLNARELDGRRLDDILPPEDSAAFARATREAFAGERPTFEYVDPFVNHAHLVSAAPVHGEDGTITHALFTLHDVTPLKEAQALLAESEERFRALFERSPDGIALIDSLDEALPGRIVDCNAAFARMNGYERSELVGAPISHLQVDPGPPDGDAKHFAFLKRVGEATLQGRHRRKDGSVFPIETSTSIITVGGRELVLGVDRDISDRIKAEQLQRDLTDRLAYQATHDALTGLPNRVLFEDRLAQALEHARRRDGLLAVLFVDLDGFKRVNDSLGHHAGDELLQQVAERFRRCTRAGDTLSRRGGDEFLFLATDLTHAEDGVRAGQRLLEALRPPFLISGHEVYASASIGMSVFPDDASGAPDLHRNADIAMYRAKAKGRDQLECFAPAMNTAAQERLRREAELRRALERGEITVHYQPSADSSTLRATACEALVRWQHPDEGLLLPGAFLPVAEESGLIRDLDVLVLRQACRQAAEWRRKGLPLERLAVNVSSLQFGRADLVDVVASALQESGLDPWALELEISESFAMKDVAETVSQFARLRGLGVRLAMDDFGTGYSSLAHLARLPFDTLKIDRSFIRPLGHDRAALPLVEAMTGLAHKLGLRVVAEGVETVAQLEILRSFGCEQIQGYLTGRPVRPPVMEELLARNRAPALL